MSLLEKPKLKGKLKPVKHALGGDGAYAVSSISSGLIFAEKYDMKKRVPDSKKIGRILDAD